jgi:hypothetical protein
MPRVLGWEDGFDAAHLAVGEADLDSVGVKGAVCQDLLYDADRSIRKP